MFRFGQTDRRKYLEECSGQCNPLLFSSTQLQTTLTHDCIIPVQPKAEQGLLARQTPLTKTPLTKTMLKQTPLTTQHLPCTGLATRKQGNFVSVLLPLLHVVAVCCIALSK